MLSRIIVVSFSWLLIAAHFSRADQNIFAIISLLVPSLLLIRRRWAHKLVVVLTAASSLIWIQTTWKLIHARIEVGEDWRRMAIILLSVASYTLFSGIFLNSSKIRERYNLNNS